jgi:response regulator RpfG family c-di-GMP phosphodiesterase
LNLIEITTSLLIALGGIIMMLNIALHKKTIKRAKQMLISDNHRLPTLYQIHLVLMVFFVLGYVLVLCSILLRIDLVGTLFTGFVFLFGAIFVLTGIQLQSTMFASIQTRHNSLIKQNQITAQTESAAIFALAYQAEMRDGETGRHLDRTSKYVEILATELRKRPTYKEIISDTYLTDLVKAAPLHDIGKVSVPDDILRKPGKLTKEEFEIIKQHCRNGAQILIEAEQRLTIRSFLTEAIKLVCHHHERWDGTGYPDGLKARQIPLSARIMALADVYDALRSKRCYKNALTHEKTKAVIVHGRGSQFDPDVVDAFISAEAHFNQTSIELEG